MSSDDDAAKKLPDESDDAQEIKTASPDPHLAQLIGMIQALDAKVDARLHDTRPLWQALQEQVGQLRDEMRERFDKLESQVGLLDKQVKLFDKKMDKLALDILEVRGEQGLLEDRVDKLERKPS